MGGGTASLVIELNLGPLKLKPMCVPPPALASLAREVPRHLQPDFSQDGAHVTKPKEGGSNASHSSRHSKFCQATVKIQVGAGVDWLAG